MNIIERREILIFAFLSFLAVPSFFMEGFIFTLDSVPIINDHELLQVYYGEIAPVFGGTLPLNLLFGAVKMIVPVWLTQRIFLFAILFVAGLSMYYSVPVNSEASKYFAGFLYMLNPFTYVRLLAGHWELLFAYAFLPLAVKCFIDFLENNNKKNIIKTVIFTTLVAFSTHILFMTVVIYFILFVSKIVMGKNISLRNIFIMLTIFILLNLYWLFPVATSENTLVSRISSNDIVAFAPHTTSFSVLFSLASMHGFWREGYIYAKDFLPLWYLLFVLIFFLAVHGFISNYKHQKPGIYVKSFAIIGIIGLILAAGANYPFTGLFNFLFDHIPIIKGMRDTQKFVALLVISYAYLGALGVADFEKEIRSLDKRKKYFSILIVLMALISPIIYSFTFFGSFANQIKPGDYPEDWYEVNDFLNNDTQDFKVIFFPWHMYMDYKWVPNNDKRIKNPAPYFFDKPVLSGTNIEIGRIYTQMENSDQAYINFILQNKDNITNLGNLVVPLNVKYILLAKEVDYKKYFFLFQQRDLELTKETENFYIFKNNQNPIKYPGASNAYGIKNAGNFLLKYKKFEKNLVSYIFSLVFLIVLIYFYFNSEKD